MEKQTEDNAMGPVVLVILDGWGYREESEGNAIAAAKTPVMDHLRAVYSSTLIQAAGEIVGLPRGQMGNSEVGHLTIGSGRIISQELTRISKDFKAGHARKNSALLEICQTVRQRSSKLHLIGLCSTGGVHAHLDHLLSLLDIAKAEGVTEVCVHVITDGRDSLPQSGMAQITLLQDYMNRIGVGRIVTMSGRYYSMDRDKRWERTQRAYDVMVDTGSGCGDAAEDVLAKAYTQGITDEFLPPTRIDSGAIEAGDGVIFINFRSDRARQLTQALVDTNFDGFDRQFHISDLEFVTFTQYDSSFPVAVAFPPQTLKNTLGEVIANAGLRQFRIAETEKYAHVTYFFNGGVEEAFEGEERLLIPSPKVATFDVVPEMSADKVTASAIAAIRERRYAFIAINYANPDMVGHTGNMSATIQAIEAVDHQLGQLVSEVKKVGGHTIITADHGNAEWMRDEQGRPWMAHTSNPVPLLWMSATVKDRGLKPLSQLREGGCLSDIAPTILELLQLPQPPEMTGQSLLSQTATWTAQMMHTSISI